MNDPTVVEGLFVMGIGALIALTWAIVWMTLTDRREERRLQRDDEATQRSVRAAKDEGR